jgi:hypothetical protein
MTGSEENSNGGKGGGALAEGQLFACYLVDVFYGAAVAAIRLRELSFSSSSFFLLSQEA